MGRCASGESVRGEWDEEVETVGLPRASSEAASTFRKVTHFTSWGEGGWSWGAALRALRSPGSLEPGEHHYHRGPQAWTKHTLGQLWRLILTYLTPVWRSSFLEVVLTLRRGHSGRKCGCEAVCAGSCGSREGLSLEPRPPETRAGGVSGAEAQKRKGLLEDEGSAELHLLEKKQTFSYCDCVRDKSQGPDTFPTAPTSSSSISP